MGERLSNLTPERIAADWQGTRGSARRAGGGSSISEVNTTKGRNDHAGKQAV